MHATFEYIMIYGAFLSTTGAGLQSLTGAPRLLQDRIIFPGNKIQILRVPLSGLSGNEIQNTLLLFGLGPRNLAGRPIVYGP